MRNFIASTTSISHSFSASSTMSTVEEKQFEFVNAEKTCWLHSAVREMRGNVPRNHSRLDHGQIMIRIGSRLSPVTVGSHPGQNQNRHRVTVESRLSQVADGSRVKPRSDPQQHYTSVKRPESIRIEVPK